MSEHTAAIRWAHTAGDFLKGRYSRGHTWTFDGGLTVPASPSPSNVPKPYANEASVDPEGAFVAAISSCHMLTFLFLAMKAGFEVASYEDDAIRTMTKNERNIPWVSAVTLQPRIVYAGERHPSAEDESRLHHGAHEQCVIANPVKTEVTVRSR